MGNVPSVVEVNRSRKTTVGETNDVPRRRRLATAMVWTVELSVKGKGGEGREKGSKPDILDSTEIDRAGVIGFHVEAGRQSPWDRLRGVCETSRSASHQRTNYWIKLNRGIVLPSKWYAIISKWIQEPHIREAAKR